MGYNRAKKKMKKNLFVTAILLIGMIAGAMVFSSFKAPKQEKNTETTSIAMGDDWKVIRENVPYCDADANACAGYGKVWINKDTYQVAFQVTSGLGDTTTKFDLAEYTGKDGYNMRFYYKNKDKYYYVNLYIPSAVFD